MSARLRVGMLEKVLEHLLVDDNDEAGDEFDCHVRETLCLQAEYWHGEKQEKINKVIAFYNGFPDSFAIDTMYSIRTHYIDYEYIDNAITALMAIMIWLYHLKDWGYLPPPPSLRVGKSGKGG